MRVALRRRRAALSPAESAESSSRLCDAILGAELFAEGSRVAAFVPVKGEPDIRPVLRRALRGDGRLWLPRVVDDTRLEFAAVESLEQLVPARFGLLEPPASSPGTSLARCGAELVVVPGLGFGSDGSRIGYGRGYYDRALSGFAEGERPPCIGVCFAAFLDPSEGPIPMEETDRRVDFVATERGVISVTNPAET